MDNIPDAKDLVVVNKLWKEHKNHLKRIVKAQKLKAKEDLKSFMQWIDESKISSLVLIDETLEFLYDCNMLSNRGELFRDAFFHKYKNKMYPKPSYLPSKDGINKPI